MSVEPTTNGTDFQVTASQIESLQSLVDQAMGDVHSHKGNIYTAITDVFNYYKGGSATAYQNFTNVWDERVAKIGSELNRFIEYLRGFQSATSSQEAQTTSDVNQVSALAEDVPNFMGN